MAIFDPERDARAVAENKNAQAGSIATSPVNDLANTPKVQPGQLDSAPPRAAAMVEEDARALAKQDALNKRRKLLDESRAGMKEGVMPTYNPDDNDTIWVHKQLSKEISDPNSPVYNRATYDDKKKTFMPMF